MKEEDRKIFFFIKETFGIKPKNLSLYKKALQHKSIAKEIKPGLKNSNERLEFLGDVVLDNIVALHLFLIFNDKDEGFLTKLKSKIVSRKTLSEIALQIGVDKVIYYHRGKSISIESISGNALEAIIGAIYLDKGFKKTYEAITEVLINNYVDIRKLSTTESDFKSQILIWGQREKRSVKFEVSKETDKGPTKIYDVNLLIDQKVISKGSGTSKKKAEQEASERAWNKMNLS